MGIHRSTSGKNVKDVSAALAALSSEYISMPSTPNEIEEVRQNFYNIAKFPRCIGAIDCTHIRIQSPGGDQAEIYRNRKDFFSLNVQTICDANLKIRNIVARWPGSSHDSTIFSYSVIKRRLAAGEFGDNFILGDSGYGIQKYLITPLLSVQTTTENIFNESQIRTRNTVERSYGVWKRRFSILSKGMALKNIKTIQAVIVACAVLHNIAREFGEQLPRVSQQLEKEIQLTMFNQQFNVIEGGIVPFTVLLS